MSAEAPERFVLAVGAGVLGATFRVGHSGPEVSAAELARAAEYHEQTQIRHYAVFGRGRAQATSALGLLKVVRRVEGARIFVPGRGAISTASAELVLGCYLESCRIGDWRAHCVTGATEEQLFGPRKAPRARVTLGSGDLPSGPHYLLPCSLLLRYGMRLNPDHPSTMREQIEARAQAGACDWCPRFDIRQFVRVQ